MTNEQFLQQFGHFIDAPNGIQKLRELILQLAVQGKLVTQDPNDEPASEFLKKVRDRKTANMAEKRYAKLKKLPSSEILDPAFDLPESWNWSILDEITYTVHYGYTASADHNKKGIRLLRITDIQNNKVDWNSVPGCEINEKSYNANSLNENDILIARTGGTIGKTYIVENLSVKAVFASYLIRAIPSELMCPKYLKIFMETPLYWSQLYAKSAGTGQPNVNATSLRALQAPIPPLAEQHSIVAKVDELMALCDQLEAERNTRDTTHQHLIRAVHHPLTEASDAATTQTAWHRIRDNFADLYTTLESVQALRQTILRLAVQGKLVPQDSGDESASVLLEKIKVQKAHQEKGGRAKKRKPLVQIDDSKLPYDLPAAWEWMRLSDLDPEYKNGISSRGDASGDQTTVLRLADIKGNQISLSDTRQLIIDRAVAAKYKLLKDDLLIIRVNGSADIVGKFILSDLSYDAIYCDHFIRLRINKNWYLPAFLELVAASSLVRDRINDLFITTAGQKTVNQGHIGSLLIPMLSKSEQSRIVAKVGDLTALCDQLEANIRNKNDTATRYTEAIVQQIAAA